MIVRLSLLAALLLACSVARAETSELRIAQQHGFSYLQLMYVQRDRLIVFDLAMLHNAPNLVQKGLLKEDNTRFDKTRIATSNAELVKKIVDVVCGQCGRIVATHAQAHVLLGLA